jgi:hypothetical protein
VPLLDEDARMVDALSQAELVDAGLQAALQEIFNLKGKNVIELHARFIKNTDTDETANESIAFEQALWVFLVKGEKLTKCWVSDIAGVTGGGRMLEDGMAKSKEQFLEK